MRKNLAPVAAAKHADVVIKDVPETKLAVAATFAADAVHDLAANNEELEAAGLCRDPRVPLAAGRGIVPTHHVDHAESFLPLPVFLHPGLDFARIVRPVCHILIVPFPLR